MHEELRFPADRRAPGKARHAVRRTLDESGHGDAVDTAEILTTELVTNAVTHGAQSASAGDEREVEVTVDVDGVVRVGVADDDPTPPVPRQAASDETSGRGLALVRELATRWGVELRRGGKQVWFEVRSCCPPSRR